MALFARLDFLMNNRYLSSLCRQVVSFGIVGLLTIALAIATWVVPVQSAIAAVRVSAELEQQILQVIRDHPEVLVESVAAYQQQQQQQRQEQVEAVLQNLKAHPDEAIGQSPTLGSASQEVVLLEFSDFQCPYCARAREALEEFVARNEDEVTLVYKNFPLVNIHPQAMPAAKAAWAAGQQGKFWPYHDALFSQQDRLGEDLYLEIAETLGLDLELFNRDRGGETASRAIEQDVAMAVKLAVPGTPFLVMNGEVFQDRVEVENLEQLLATVKD